MVIISTNHTGFLRKFDSLVAIERRMGSSCHERAHPGHGNMGDADILSEFVKTFQFHFPAKDIL